MSAKEDLDQVIRSIGPNLVELIEVLVQIDGTIIPVLIPGEVDEELAKRYVNANRFLLKSFNKLVCEKPWYEKTKESCKPGLTEVFVEMGVSTRLSLELWRRNFERYELEFNALSEKNQIQRIRRYHPEVVKYDPASSKRTIMVNVETLEYWKNSMKSALDEKLPRGWVNHAFRWLTLLAFATVLSTPERDSEFYDGTRKLIKETNCKVPEGMDFEDYVMMNRMFHEIQNVSAMDVGYIISLFIHETINCVQDILTLEDLEKQILGVMIKDGSDKNSFPIPKGDVLVAITECLNAAANKAWQPVKDGMPYYETTPLDDGLTVKMTLSKDLSHPLVVINCATQFLQDIDLLTVRLNTVLQAAAEQQTNPWHDGFTIDARDLAKELNLGRLGRENKATQIRGIIHRLSALRRMQVRLYWVDDNHEESLMDSNLWTIDFTAKWAFNQNSATDEPYTYLIDVAPGGWVRRCQARVNGHRDLLWLGYHDADCLLKQRVSLKDSLQTSYLQMQQNRFTVYDWLCRSLGRPKVNEKLTDRFKKKDLKKVFEAAIADLQETIHPGFELEHHSKDWTKTWVLKQVPRVRAVPIAKLRQRLGLTQEEVGRMVGYTRGRISQLERNQASNLEAVENIRRKLLSIVNQNVNAADVNNRQQSNLTSETE